MSTRNWKNQALKTLRNGKNVTLTPKRRSILTTTGRFKQIIVDVPTRVKSGTVIAFQHQNRNEIRLGKVMRTYRGDHLIKPANGLADWIHTDEVLGVVKE